MTRPILRDRGADTAGHHTRWSTTWSSIRIPSITGSEERAAAWVADVLGEIGMRVEVVRVIPPPSGRSRVAG